MSETHIKVEKNGIEDDMNLTVWNAIGGDANKQGWKRVPQAPVEVVAMKQKKADPEPVVKSEEVKEEVVTNPVGEAPVEVKSKAKTKKK